MLLSLAFAGGKGPDLKQNKTKQQWRITEGDIQGLALASTHMHIHYTHVQSFFLSMLAEMVHICNAVLRQLQ